MEVLKWKDFFHKSKLKQSKVKNQGYAPQYYIEDNHEAIIPKELFH